MSAAAARNLIFGILALQMDFMNRDALVRAMNAWVLDKAKPLAQILVEQGGLAAGSFFTLRPPRRQPQNRTVQNSTSQGVGLTWVRWPVASPRRS
jgi:hypothetical protein